MTGSVALVDDDEVEHLGRDLGSCSTRSIGSPSSGSRASASSSSDTSALRSSEYSRYTVEITTFDDSSGTAPARRCTT